MTASSGPKGRLPARVYWFRRLLVLGTALALVFAIARVLNGSPAAAPTVNLNSARQTQSAGPTGLGPIGPAPTVPAVTPSATVLAAPDGPCAIEEVTVAPVAGTANAGSTIPLTLTLQLTGIRPACTFEVNANSLVAKITAAGKRVWSSQDCPHAITPSSVVVRSGTPTTILLAWSGRYSDASCSRAAGWAMPGTYQVAAAAIGSEPAQAALTLVTRPRAIITKTAKPKTTPVKKPSSTPSKKQTPASGR